MAVAWFRISSSPLELSTTITREVGVSRHHWRPGNTKKIHQKIKKTPKKIHLATRGSRRSLIRSLLYRELWKSRTVNTRNIKNDINSSTLFCLINWSGSCFVSFSWKCRYRTMVMTRIYTFDIHLTITTVHSSHQKYEGWIFSSEAAGLKAQRFGHWYPSKWEKTKIPVEIVTIYQNPNISFKRVV